MTKLEINPALQSHTTQIAFHLTLSKAMIGALQHVKMNWMLYEAGGYSLVGISESAQWVESAVGRLPTYVAGVRALEARGLTENVPELKPWYSRPITRLSPAGERVYDLLIMAGVVTHFELPANLNRKPVKGQRKAK